LAAPAHLETPLKKTTNTNDVSAQRTVYHTC
jgi:hypothetical protein